MCSTYQNRGYPILIRFTHYFVDQMGNSPKLIKMHKNFLIKMPGLTIPFWPVQISWTIQILEMLEIDRVDALM